MSELYENESKEHEEAEGEGTEASYEERHGEGYLRRWILNFYEQADQARQDRMNMTKVNFNYYHDRHDFSHKIEGQSRQTINKQAMAVESTAAFFQQALVDEQNWWGVKPRDPRAELKVSPDVIFDLTNWQLNKAEILGHVGLGMKNGLLGGLIITKVTGEYKSVPQYVARRRNPNKRKSTLKKITKKAWQLKLDLLPHKHYLPDTEGDLGEIEETWVDYAALCALAEGPDAIYDHEMVEQIRNSEGGADSEEALDKQRRTGENQTDKSWRNQVNIKEYWGTVLDEDGRILHENCVLTLAEDKYLIRCDMGNPNWHQKSPFVVGALMPVPDSKWAKAPMDSPTRHNIVLNEIYNLMIDGGMRAVNGIGMVRVDWLEDPSEIENGIKPGTNLKVNNQCPPGAKVMEMVQSGQLPPDAVNMYNIMSQEFNAAALTSDVRSGIQPRKETSATQIVETSRTINSVFTGLTKQVEQNWLKAVLELVWQTICQFSDELDEDEVRSVLGDRADAWLKLTPEERFAATVQGVKFEVFGMSQLNAKEQDFRKWMTLMQTVGGSDVLLEAFLKEYSIPAFLKEIMNSLGVDTRKIEVSAAEKDLMKEEAEAQQPPGPQGPDQMSQVPSAAAGSLQEQLGAGAPVQSQAQQGTPAGQGFPPSRATQQ